MLQVEGLSKRFGEVAAAEQLDFEVPAGQVLALFGPTGCGKSTTLRMVAGLDPPDAGAVRLDGRDIVSLAPHRRDLALLFQHDALYPHMTVEQNLKFAWRGAPHREDGFPQAASRLEAFAELQGLMQRLPHELSGGQRQRAALARALIRRPSLILLDEPGSHWDAALRRRVRLRLRQWIRERGAAAVWVTHQRDEAFLAADRLAIMQQGRILQLGTPEEAYRRPTSLAVARMLASPILNEWPEQRGGERPPASAASDASRRFGPWTCTDSQVGLPSGAVLAIYPEALRWRPPAPELRPVQAACLESPATVGSLSELGDRREITWKCGEFEAVSVDRGDESLSPGQSAILSVDLDCLMWFPLRPGPAEGTA